jgi:hypothetical protein
LNLLNLYVDPILNLSFTFAHPSLLQVRFVATWRASETDNEKRRKLLKAQEAAAAAKEKQDLGKGNKKGNAENTRNNQG